MVQRRYWQELLEKAWKRRSVLWLHGVRRAGKTVLCQSLPHVEYFDCELPSTRRTMGDPESFLDGLRGKRAVLDEIHRLDNPSELLKIAADHYRDVHLIATGSSTLGASRRFRDTLTGRKHDVWLTPMCLADLADAKIMNLEHRLLRGGLPSFLLEREVEEREFQEWMDSYWAKDIQEMFHLERRDSFQKLNEMVLAQSGGIFEATRFAGPCEVSRNTVANYLRVLEATFVAHVIRPFSARKQSEIVSAPKVYGFDTGFVCALSRLAGAAKRRPWEPLGALRPQRDHGAYAGPRCVLLARQARARNRFCFGSPRRQSHGDRMQMVSKRLRFRQPRSLSKTPSAWRKCCTGCRRKGAIRKELRIVEGPL